MVARGLLPIAALVGIASGSGCASDRHAVARTADVGSSEAEAHLAGAAADRRAKLRFDIEGLAPVPLVRATIGRVPTWMQIDSGASVHTVPGFLARRAELTQGLRASSIAIDTWGRLEDGPVSVREQDEDLPGARAGIAGLISPQRLAPAGALVLDLVRGEMRTTTEREATRLLSSEKSELTAAAERCEGMYVVPAFVEGVRVRLIVDTGAGATVLYARSRAGAALAGRSIASRGRSFSVDGAMTTRTYEAAKILVGDVHAVHDVTLVTLELNRQPADRQTADRQTARVASPCAEDGMLGVDVLRACVLVFGDGLRIRCG